MMMIRRGKNTDRYSRIWEARIVSWDEAEEEDFRFWYEELTPEERVLAVEECTLSALKARGITEIPPMQRVVRVVNEGDTTSPGDPAPFWAGAE